LNKIAGVQGNENVVLACIARYFYLFYLYRLHEHFNMVRSLQVSLLLLWCIASHSISAQPRTAQMMRPTAEKVPFSIDTLEKRTFNYFWQLADRQLQIPDRWPTLAFSSVAATGFGLSAYLVGVERKYVTRAQAAERVLKTLEILKNLPQGPAQTGMSGYRGFYYHFLDHQEARRYRDVELSSIDSGLLMAGVLSCQTYFDQENATEKAIRATADFIYRRVEWDWMMNANQRMSMGWKPEKGFIQAEWFGYTEAMILYVLGLGSPTHPIASNAWEAWTQNYVWDNFMGQEHINFGPLFGHQYSHVWIDFKGIQDGYMRKKGMDYAENTRRATLANWNYCKQNPGKFKDYSDKIWGLTACDGPADWLYKHDLKELCQDDRKKYMGYSARGIATDYLTDDGTLAPTAAGGSLPFAPEICLPALEAMWNQYQDSLVGPYGFKDAFNPGFTACGQLPKGWFDNDYLGIDQGPIILMIENYRSGFLWNLMKRNPYIQKGLQKAGFDGGWLGKRADVQVEYGEQPVPNPEVPTNPFYYFDRAVYRESESLALPYRLLKPSNVLATNKIENFYFNKDGRLTGNTSETKYKEKKIPLVVFLHGSGERGSENEAQLRNGVLAFCEPNHWAQNPCFVLAPQCPLNDQWTKNRAKPFQENPTEATRMLLALIDQVLAENPAIDPTRIYLTGLSMGGFGTFDVLCRRPNLFAAAIALCSGGDPAIAPKIKDIPLWYFHGARDETVPIENTRQMVAALKNAGSRVKYTEYATLGHAIWQETYYNPEVLSWLFRQHK